MMPGLDISELDRRAQLFEKHINQVKATLAPAGSSGIRTAPCRYSRFSTSSSPVGRRLVDLAGGDPILDLGCGDGALSFFFESLGCKVRAMDNHHTNHNHMRGFTELRSALNSSVELEMIGIDSRFTLPDEIFGLALFLGVLYHLKNPLYALETLATHARYCLLSTRIARRTPSGTPMKHEPLAYLLDPLEANNDATN